VDDIANVIDTDLTNRALIRVPVAVGSGFITATNTDPTVSPYLGPHRVGVVVETPRAGPAPNQIQNTEIRTLLGGVQVERSGDVGSDDITILGFAGDPTQMILDFETNEDFDAAQIRFTNLVGTQSDLFVYSICVGEP
jgi:hypothetical protein